MKEDSGRRCVWGGLNYTTKILEKIESNHRDINQLVLNFTGLSIGTARYKREAKRRIFLG